jgi:hypothetical protein
MVNVRVVPDLEPVRDHKVSLAGVTSYMVFGGPVGYRPPVLRFVLKASNDNGSERPP